LEEPERRLLLPRSRLRGAKSRKQEKTRKNVLDSFPEAPVFGTTAGKMAGECWAEEWEQPPEMAPFRMQAINNQRFANYETPSGAWICCNK